MHNRSFCKSKKSCKMFSYMNMLSRQLEKHCSIKANYIHWIGNSKRLIYLKT